MALSGQSTVWSHEKTTPHEGPVHEEQELQEYFLLILLHPTFHLQLTTYYILCMLRTYRLAWRPISLPIINQQVLSRHWHQRLRQLISLPRTFQSGILALIVGGAVVMDAGTCRFCPVMAFHVISGAVPSM